MNYKELASQILKYDAFTDIEFNPDKSINCQAKSAALFVSLSKRNLLEYAMASIENYFDVILNNNKKNTTEQLSLF